jgi:hypothetical protein
MRTFSSRKVATLSTQSLKATNQLLFLSALSTISRNSISRSSIFACSSAIEVTDIEFEACDVVRAVSDCVRRATAGPSVGIGVDVGTETKSDECNNNEMKTYLVLACTSVWQVLAEYDPQ